MIFLSGARFYLKRANWTKPGKSAYGATLLHQVEQVVWAVIRADIATLVGVALEG